MRLKNLFAGAVTLAFVALFVLLSSAVHAAVLSFGSGGTGSGTLTYDETTNTFTHWDITTTTSLCCVGITYSDTIAGSSATSPSGFNAAGFFDFSIFSPTGGNNGLGGTLFFVVPGNATGTAIAGLPGPGQTSLIQIITLDSASSVAANCPFGGAPFGQPCGVEQEATGQGRDFIQPAFFSVTDAPDTVFNFTLTSAPLPATLPLFATGIGG